MKKKNGRNKHINDENENRKRWMRKEDNKTKGNDLSKYERTRKTELKYRAKDRRNGWG